MDDAEAGYEISVCSLEGRLLRKIRRENNPIKVPENLKRDVKDRPKGHPLSKKLYFPEYMPVFQYFFCDDSERLFAVALEKGPLGQYISDVFNAEGIYIARASLGYFDLLKAKWEGNELGIKAKRGGIYCLMAKPSGFKELLVNQLIWTN